MKVIIAGGRGVKDSCIVADAMGSIDWGPIDEVVSGGASGVDTLGEGWAKQRDISVRRFSANWKDLGKKAGPLRNCKMAKYADGLVAIWDGRSKGTRNMIDAAILRKLRIYIHFVH